MALSTFNRLSYSHFYPFLLLVPLLRVACCMLLAACYLLRAYFECHCHGVALGRLFDSLSHHQAHSLLYRCIPVPAYSLQSGEPRVLGNLMSGTVIQTARLGISNYFTQHHLRLANKTFTLGCLNHMATTQTPTLAERGAYCKLAIGRTFEDSESKERGVRNFVRFQIIMSRVLTVFQLVLLAVWIRLRTV
jgi:hypothetical protein